MVHRVETLFGIANTSPGTQTFAIADSETPTAVVVSVVSNDGGGDAFSFGVSDGTNQRVSANYTADAGQDGSFLSARRGATDELVMLIDSAGEPFAEGNFVQFVQGGFEISWANPAPLPNTRVNIQLHFGVAAHVGTAKSPFTKNTSDSVLGIPFRPRSVMFFSHGGAVYNDLPLTDQASFSIGAVDSALRNFFAGKSIPFSEDSGTLTGGRAELRTGLVHESFTEAFLGSGIEVTAYTNDGFTIFTRGAVNGSQSIAYLAFEDWFSVKVIDTPSAVGSDIEFLRANSPAGGVLYQLNLPVTETFAGIASASVMLFSKAGASTSGTGWEVASAEGESFGFSGSAGPKLCDGKGNTLVEGAILALTNQRMMVSYSTVQVGTPFYWLLIAFPEPVKHFRKIEDQCRVTFDALIGTPENLVVSYPNTPNAEVDTEVQIEFQDSRQGDIRGTSASFNTVGNLRVSMFAEIDDGDGDLLRRADLIYHAFLNLKAGIVLFRQPTIRRLGVVDKTHYEVEVLIPFYAAEQISMIPVVAGTLVEETSDCAFVARVRFATLFPTLFVVFDNQPNNGLPNDVWAEVKIIQGTSTQSQQNTRRVFGRMVVSVFCPMETGTLDSLLLIDEIAEQFRTISISGVHFRTPSIVSSLRDRGFWRMDLNCPYFFEEITSV